MVEALCFDVYGSTHDQHSTPVDRIREVTGVPVTVAERVSKRWAREQLRYSFELTMMGQYRTWRTLAEQALTYSLNYHGLTVPEPDRERLLDAYQHLEPYEDWGPFERLADQYNLYILSDGNPEMLETLARNTGFETYLSGIVSAHEVEMFKPRPAVYEQMETVVDGGVSDCRLVATHHFDVAGALNVGMEATLVNRFGEPPSRAGVEPDQRVQSYAELADLLC